VRLESGICFNAKSKVKAERSCPQGANSALGIGRASAHQFAQNGARALYLCDYDDFNLELHKRDITERWPAVEVHLRRFDAADEAAIKHVVDDTVSRYGRLDVFFANAGITGVQSPFYDVDADEFMEVIRVNTLGLVGSSIFMARITWTSQP
jgi:NAD(P)-dependent dehydrogenase (short-subunit alcohol dehydrogenase family)